MRNYAIVVLISMVTSISTYADIKCSGVSPATGENIQVMVEGNPLQIYYRDPDAEQKGWAHLLVRSEWDASVLVGLSDTRPFSAQPHIIGRLTLSSKSKRSPYKAELELDIASIGRKNIVETYVLNCKGQVNSL